MMLKRVLCLVIVCLLITATALAGTSVSGSGSNYSADLSSVPTFKFIPNHQGFGIGRCPVYTAPSLDAYRCANGKAEVNTNYEIYYLGKDAQGWMMVRYETNKGNVRVGYIPPSYARKVSTKYKLNFVYIPQKATKTLYVTDNPMSTWDYYAILSPGETYYVLGHYDYYGDWWYIECEVDGKQARGFIPVD